MSSATTHFTLEQIRAFLAVAEFGSISGAARARSQAQPAITYLIRTLEKQIQASLFERGPRGARLTPAGQALLPTARALRDEAEQFANRSQALSAGLTEELVVAVDRLFPSAFLARAMAQLHHRHPRLRLQLRSDVLDGISKRVLEGHAALGLTSMYADMPSELYRVAITSSKALIVASRHHELAQDPAISEGALRRHLQLILQREDGGIGMRAFALFGTPVWQLSSMTLMLELLRAGAGFAAVPEHSVVSDIAEGTLVSLSLPFPQLAEPQAFYLIWRSDRPLSTEAQWFVDSVLD